MSLFSRILRVGKGKANEGVDALEDATFETTIQQTVRDMKAELEKVVENSAAAVANCNGLEKKYAELQSQSEHWQGKAKLALSKQNRDLAAKALEEKGKIDRQIASMKVSVENAQRTRDSLKSQVGKYRQKIEEAERNASTLIARKQAANAQKKVAQAMAGIDKGDNAFSALKRFEDNVDKEESSAAAFEEMAGTATTSLEDEFAALESDPTDALAALEAEMAEEAAAASKKKGGKK